MMDLTEKLYRFVAQEVLGTTTITYKGVEMDLGKPFARITMVDAVKKYAGVDFDQKSGRSFLQGPHSPAHGLITHSALLRNGPLGHGQLVLPVQMVNNPESQP